MWIEWSQVGEGLLSHSPNAYRGSYVGMQRQHTSLRYSSLCNTETHRNRLSFLNSTSAVLQLVAFFRVESQLPIWKIDRRIHNSHTAATSGQRETMKLWHFSFAISLVIALGSAANAEKPLDLFANVPKLFDGYIRIGARNLRHINVEVGAHYFLTGVTEEAVSEILTKTFAKAIIDLGLDIVAITEHQPRSGEPNRLEQIRSRLNGGQSGPWRAAESEIDDENPE